MNLYYGTTVFRAIERPEKFSLEAAQQLDHAIEDVLTGIGRPSFRLVASDTVYTTREQIPTNVRARLRKFQLLCREVQLDRAAYTA